jgi:carboxypeptidase C (cathepsin A)
MGEKSEEKPLEQPIQRLSHVSKEFSYKSEQNSFNYQVQCGTLSIFEKDEEAAEMFFTYYSRKDLGKRPITFLFNGGPGAASAYLHLGAVGPKRVVFNSDGTVPKPPVTLEDNPESWLEFSDLVFVDPVGTGFSRILPPKKDGENGGQNDGKKAAKAGDEKRFYGIEKDLDSLGHFLSSFLSKFHKWTNPVFIAGESYGGYRVGRLARILQEKFGIGLSGSLIISPALEFSLLDPHDYDLLYWIDVFPGMAASAAHHGKSSLSQYDYSEVLSRAEEFAATELSVLLIQGNSMDERKQKKILNKAAAMLGLDPELVQLNMGRIDSGKFARELLKSERKRLGLYDGTITIEDPYPDRTTYQGPDPTLYSIERLFASGINHWLRTEIGVDTNMDYHLLNHEVNTAWKIDMERHALQSKIGATDDLRFGMVLNPFMKVLISHGIYDLVTPYFSSNRIAENMKLTESMKDQLIIQHFKGGHMFYSWDESRAEFTKLVKKIMADA